jgi:hypothetical protein
MSGFRELVTRYSDNQTTRRNGGDLLTADRNTTRLPRPAVDAILAAKVVGVIVGPIDLGGRYGIFRTMEVIDGFVRPLSEVNVRIRQHLAQEATSQNVDGLMQKLRASIPVTKYDQNIQNIAVVPGLPGEAPIPIEEAVAPAAAPGSTKSNVNMALQSKTDARSPR